MTPLPHAVGMNRREFLQVGYSGLLSVSAATAVSGTARGSAVTSRPGSPKSVILVFTTGASSHIDTFDPKPDAPPEIRGEFGAIPTATPGLMFSEHLPMLAARSRKFSVLRTLAHKDNNHTAATHHVITGAIQPNVRFDKPLSREDWPCYAAGLSAIRPPAAGVPAGVTLPTFLQGGPLIWPGQHAGFVGPSHDPWQITSDPNKPDFRVGELHPAEGLDVTSLANRQALLAEIDGQQRALAGSAAAGRLTDSQEKAFTMLTSGTVAKAFDIAAESPRTRDRYGRHMFGQSLLLARRLAGVGVPMIQANMGRVQNWDTHSGNFKKLKGELLPALDRAVAALIDDLADSGQLDDTLVIVTGDFGRTPKVNTKDGGRDHWAACFSALVAGAGVRGGTVVGQSDAHAAYPTTPAYSPDDLGATVYNALGIDPASEIHDRLGRPVQLNRGHVIRGLYTGAGA